MSISSFHVTLPERTVIQITIVPYSLAFDLVKQISIARAASQTSIRLNTENSYVNWWLRPLHH